MNVYEEHAVISAPDVRKRLLSEDYEHPFKWDARTTMKIIPSANEVLSRVTDQLSTVTIDADLQFEYLMYYVGQSYAYSCNEEFQEALDSLERGEGKLNEVTANSPDDTMYGQAFLHLTRSMKAFLLTLTDDVNAASKILSLIPSISGMDEENRAALEGLRGLFYGEYGFEGFKLAVEFLSKAIEMNSNESSWHFLNGKYLSRLRHVERPQDVPNEEEMYHLEFAAKLKKNGTYSLFLAQMYHEMAKCYNSRFRSSSGLSKDQFQKEKKKCSDLNEKSCKLYKESLSLKPDCPQMLFRCAKGFMRLPYPYRDEKHAKKLLEKGLELIPDSGFGNHSMAQYYERVEKDPQKAIKHLKICEEQRIFPAVMDLVRLEFQICEATDTVQRLEALMKEYHEVIQKNQILVLLSSYHLFSLNDLRKACQYANEIKRLNGNYEYLKKLHQPFLVRGTAQHFSKMINLQEVLIDEIRIAALEQTWSPEDKRYFEAFLEGLSSSSGKTVSLDQKPQYLKSNIIADGEKAITIRSSRGDAKDGKENTKDRKEDSKNWREGNSARDRVPKFKFSKTYEERKNKSSSSVRGSLLAREKNTSVRSNSKDEDETNQVVDTKNRDDTGDEEVVRSMRKMKTQDSQSSNKNSRPQKAPSPDPLMMAMLDKYRC